MILRLLAAGIIVCAAGGCVNTQTSSNAPASKGTNAPPKIEGTARPVYPISGRVALVNEKARFVIIDFTNSRPPELEQKLSLYRAGLKVAEVKVSGPFRNTTVAADITAGEARYGDEVKSE